jgi:hypothetical protein
MPDCAEYQVAVEAADIRNCPDSSLVTLRGPLTAIETLERTFPFSSVTFITVWEKEQE